MNFVSKLCSWAVISVFVLLTSVLSSCTNTDSNYKNRVVVKVNDVSLTAEEFSDQLLNRLRGFNILSAKDPAIIAQAKNAVVQDFIVRVVTEEWAKSKSIFIRKEQLDNEIQEIQKNYPNEIIFRKSLADNAISYDKWQNKLEYTLLERLVLAELRKKVNPPTLDQLKTYYQDHKNLYQVPTAVKLRQVVVETESTAKRISKLISQGRTIPDLAKNFSISSEASLGGDIGWIEKGMFSGFDPAFQMRVGQKSQIVKGPNGYHIFEVVDKRTAKTLPFEAVRSQLERSVIEVGEQEVYSTWLEEQVLKAHVYKDDDLIQHIQVYAKGTK